MQTETAMQTLGDWELNEVHCADSAQALQKLPNDCVDLIITSPPYWGQRGNAGVGLEEDPREYVENVTQILLEAMRALKETGLLWLNVADSYNTPINWRKKDHEYSTLGKDEEGLDPENSAYTKNRGRRRAFIEKEAGWLQYGNLLGLPYRLVLKLCENGKFFRGEVIWHKRKAMPEGRCRRPHRKHEAIYIVANSEKEHLFRKKPPVPSVWDLKLDANQTSHNSTFPLSLPMSCIECSGMDPGGVVLDPFMGSGTAGMAAALQGFDYLGFDLDERHVETARKRIKTASYEQSLDL
jgi:DNA modification methylase